ncbi:hypothetical protein FocTR4_00004128 [Fusarium oxysporum f. sp. cubense]|uniref:Uncharacterized protein n=1 Tax=Fusarium oxysporum f. sp. cubense TaxID=61366 RepID=A0A5C6T8S6_FUSOC|nr:hypothetical protein FocTR4_00004128 [Fusarium oxysporum f. sp. cubense]
MADNGDKKKQAHNDPKNKGKDKDDDKQLTSGAGSSGTLLQIMPPNTLRHPAVEDVMDQLGAGAIKQYTDQLGRNQLCVSTLVGVPAIFFKGDNESCLTQVGDIAAEMQKIDQRFSGMLLFNDNDVSGVVVLTDNKVLKPECAPHAEEQSAPAVHVQAKLWRHPVSAGKDEGEWEIESDEEETLSDDNILRVRRRKKKTEMERIARQRAMRMR